MPDSTPNASPPASESRSREAETVELRPALALSESLSVPLVAAPTLAPAPAAPPPRVGRYEITGRLGEGGLGTVYAGTDPLLNRRVAIKLPRRTRSASETQAFLDEARRLARLEHPGIVTVFDVGLHDGLCYIVTTLLEGETLWAYSRRQQLPVPESVRIVAEVADALAHAHSLEVVHRDIKPGNIIVTPSRRPVVIDFGLGVTHDSYGRPGQVAGTVAFMSPEQVRGQAHRIDGRTDIYSLGVVLYYLLTGRQPFRSDDTHELMRRVEEDDPQPPRQLVQNLPPALERVCMAAMAKDPSERFTTAGDFAAALRESISGSAAALAPGQHVVSFDPTTAAPPADSPSRQADSHLNSSTQSTGHSSRREAERRQVTVAVYSLDLEQQEGKEVDPEQRFDLTEQFQKLMNGRAVEFDGEWVPTSGPESAVSFGYPVAHEDAAARAVRASLALMHDVAAWNEQARGARLAVGAVIHSGEVVAEQKPGEGSGRVVLIGDVLPTAARLAALSEPGTVEMTGATRRLVGGYFESTPLEPRRVRGSQAAIELHRVEREVDIRNRVELVQPGNLTPLIGRDTELGILKDRWERAIEGMGQVVLLAGDAGLGKSRLIRELREFLTGERIADQPNIVEIRCSSHYQSTSLYPIVEFLERLLEFHRLPSAEDRLGRIEVFLTARKLAAPENTALIASLLNVPLGDRPAPPQLTPQKQKERIIDLLLAWLSAASSERPVLFVVEDLHWADASTLEFLGRHIEEANGRSILTVFTFRPEFNAPWRVRPQFTQVALSKLTRRQIGEMIRKRTHRADFPESLIHRLVERTDGVPLFIEEFTTLIVESGMLERSSPSDDTAFLSAIPPTLQDLLVARLERMACNTEVVQAAATIGREFSFALLGAICELTEEALLGELDKLVRAELLFQKGKASEAQFIFKHALIQDAAYGSLLKKKRQQIHQRIAVVLETKFPETVRQRPEILAHHYTEAALFEPAVRFWLAAGQLDVERSANVEATEHLGRGLKLLGELPETPERDQLELGLMTQAPALNRWAAGPQSRDSLELELLTVISAPLMAVKGYTTPDVERMFFRARELCKKSASSHSLFVALHGLYRYSVVRGRLTPARELADEAFQLAKRLGDPSLVVEGHRAHTLATGFAGMFEECRHHASEVLRLYDVKRERTHAFTYGADPAIIALIFTAWSDWFLGRPKSALKTSDELLARSAQLGHAHSRAFALGWAVSTVHAFRRDWVAAERWADETIRIGTEHSFSFWPEWGHIIKGAALGHRGRPSEGAAIIRERLVRFANVGVGMGRPLGLVLLAELLLEAGDARGAGRAVDEALEIEAEHPDFYHAEAHRLHGRVLATLHPNDPAPARAALARAVETSRAQKSPMLELRALADLATLTNHAEPVRELLARIADAADEPDVTEITARLRLLP